jgi:AcrR family transcriptional regulator
VTDTTDAVAAAPESSPQRERIIDIALQLMSDQGASNTSMRQLAKACGVNVAALYYYFPSKADILRSVIEERRYELRLTEIPPASVDLPPAERLVGFFDLMWEGALEEESVWRLLLVESIRRNADAVAVGADLVATLNRHLVEWLEASFPDVPLDAEAVANAMIGQLLGLFVETQFCPVEQRDAMASGRARHLAALFFR